MLGRREKQEPPFSAARKELKASVGFCREEEVGRRRSREGKRSREEEGAASERSISRLVYKVWNSRYSRGMIKFRLIEEYFGWATFTFMKFLLEVAGGGVPDFEWPC